MGRDPKKNPPAKCIPPEQWLGTAVSSNRTLQDIWAEQLTAHIAGGRRALRDVASLVTRRFWNGCCAYCGDQLDNDWTWEHFEPQSKGGDDSVGNCIAACQTCNSKRGSSDPFEFMRSIGRDDSQISHVKTKIAAWQELSRSAKTSSGEDHDRGMALLVANGAFSDAKTKYNFDPDVLDDRRSCAAAQRTDPFA